MTEKKTPPVNKEEVQKAATEIRRVFIANDPAWNACGQEDAMGIYRFLTGKNRDSMSHLFNNLEKEIATIILYGDFVIENPNTTLA